MYADRVTSQINTSVKDRLNNNNRRTNNNTASDNKQHQSTRKRQRQNDDKWKHDLYDVDEEPEVSNPRAGVRDLRQKLQKKGHSQLYRDVKGTTARGTQDLRQKLSGSMHAQPENDDLPQPKEVVEVPKPARKSIPVEVPTPETKKPTNPSSRKKSQQKAEPSVDIMLQSLGLEKYSITFQAEEIDMTALMHMNDEDLKALGIPMGPRKKIILALDSRG